MARNQIKAQENKENRPHKRRKVAESGNYKTVYQRPKEDKRDRVEEMKENKEMNRNLENNKRRKIEKTDPIIPEEKLDIDWQVRRKEMLHRREMEEKDRRAKIRKARGLENGWRLTNLCREFIKENSNTWQEMNDKREEERKDVEREERRTRANNKKSEYWKKRETNKNE